MSHHLARTGHLFRGILLLLPLAGTAPVSAQHDLSVAEVLEPASGCALTSNEAVTIRLFNYGSTLPAGTVFDVAYEVNAGTSFIDFIVLPSPLLSNSSLEYTFVIPADLSLPGTYIIDSSVSLPGDANPTNDASFDNIVENTVLEAGTLSGPASGSSGVLTLTGHSGPIVQWEESPDAQRWFKLANTTATQAYSDLTATTRFRVRIAKGDCPPAVSNVLVVEP